jgi:hypothetical protein
MLLGMKSKRTLAGEVTQSNAPVWAALERLVGTDLMGRFMWMFELELEDGGRVHAYKDYFTRRYLPLAEDGRAFYYTESERYCEIDTYTALAGVYERRETAGLTEDEEEALGVALAKASAGLTAL